MKLPILSALALTLTIGCGAEQDYGAGGGGDGFGANDAGAGVPECFSSNECPTGFSCSEFGTCVPPSPGSPDGGTGPAEVEVELSQPVNSERYVYVAMTELDSLAKIDGTTLEVSSVPVGDQPEVLQAIPGSDGVVVLDQNNGTVTILRPSGTGNDTRVVPTLPHMNRLDVDPTGAFAVAWFDLRKAAEEAGGLGFVGDIGSFQDITVIRLAQDNERAVDLTVGFRPREIEFDAAGTRAYAVTDDGVSVVDLASVTDGGPAIIAPIPMTTDPLAEPLSMEVNVTESGDFAVVRETARDELRVVALAGPSLGAMNTLSLPAEPTDVDLRGDRAYAVLRATSELAVVDLSAGLPSPSDVELVDLAGEVAGSMEISPDGSHAVLYTNASDVERITIIDLSDPAFPHQTYSLQKAVRSLGFDPTGSKVLVTHAKAFGSPFENGIDFEEFIDRSYGYSLFDVATGFDKLQITPDDPGAFAFSTTSPRAYVLIDGGDADGATSETHVIELDTGVVRVQQMNSPPESVGILPAAGMAFVNQRHALGRVSFINVVTDAMRTVTGFDLNSRIVD